MVETFSQILSQGRDPLAEATGGNLKWTDPGMDDYCTGESFTTGKRVEVLTEKGWLAGTVLRGYDGSRIDTYDIQVECERQWHNDPADPLKGKGAYVAVQYRRRREVLSEIRPSK